MSREKTIRLATRGSALALSQAELARTYLGEHFPDLTFELSIIKTSGDTHMRWSLEKQGGAGLFTAEVEAAVREGEADIAVHSAKDMPSKDSEGMVIAGYLPRANPLDVLVLREGVREPAFIATSSPRRRAQAKAHFPKAVWSEIRGNVQTRLNKIVRGDADATFLASAGLMRLGIEEYEGVRFVPMSLEEMVPAGGQGAIALQTRKDKAERWSAKLCSETARAVTVERQFLARLGVGCHTAFGVHWENGNLWLFHENLGKPLRVAFDHDNPLARDEAMGALIRENNLTP